MIMTADYIFYRSRFGGTKISGADYERYSKKASAMMDSWLSADAPETENARMCLCEIAEFLYDCEKRRGIAGETTDGYSVSYLAECYYSGYEIARRWLSADGSLYRGDWNE